MTDSTGNTNYTYDGLSRLTNESKYFDDLPNAPVTNNRYDIAYTYNLAGGLETITDPFGYTVTYSHDSSGRLSKVEGDATTNNPTGKYAKDIKYRAFGAIKQMDYDLPNEVSRIKMEFDNRLRIDHSEVTSPSEAGGYLLNADYEYSADSRIKAKDDLIRDQLDQTSKYDFAGRLVFNQFPMVENNESLSVRLYQQTIVYDAFSMMTSRTGEHWGTGIGFTETYLNGRIQNRPGMVYDASGNITKTGSTYSPHDFQETEFDAAGRRVEFLSSVKARWGSLLNMVTEKKTKQEYDGNGKPVKNEEGFQFYHAVNDPPPQNPPATIVTGFMVWSTVLGQRLTKLVPDGNKWETHIIAGAASIAIDDVQTGILKWKAADPVTGTSATFSYSSGGSGRTVNEYEPLGQEVSIDDPAELPDPPPNESVSHFVDMERQCERSRQSGHTFGDMPAHCQIRILQTSLTSPGEYLYRPKREKPKLRIPLRKLFGHEGQHVIGSASDKMLSYGMKATAKPENTYQDEEDEGGCSFDEEGNPSCAVNVPLIDMEETGWDEPSEIIAEAVAAAREILEQNGGDNACANFFNGGFTEGQNTAVAALNQLATKLAAKKVTDGIGTRAANGIRGRTNASSHPQGGYVQGLIDRGYLGFTEANVNTDGPFLTDKQVYNLKRQLFEAPLKLGGFQPNTLGSRIFQLLHEVGHSVIKSNKTKKGRVNLTPVLKPDGGNASRSDKNNDKVEKHCAEQIKASLQIQ